MKERIRPPKNPTRPCNRCHGSGMVHGKTCETCKGKGEIISD